MKCSGNHGVGDGADRDLTVSPSTATIGTCFSLLASTGVGDELCHVFPQQTMGSGIVNHAIRFPQCFAV
jgi:hypothetical protein